MSKYLLRNAATTYISDIYLIKDGLKNQFFQEVYDDNLINLIKNADVLGVFYGGGGGGPQWGSINTYTVDFNSGQSLSVKKGNNTTTLTGYPATCTNNNNITGMFYVEYSQNDPDLVSYDENEGCYMRPRNIGRFGRYSDEEPGIIAQPDVVQIQKSSRALTSIFPGVAYNGNNNTRVAGPETSSNATVIYNPVNAKPYTVYVYGSDGTLLDTYMDCDVYNCAKAGGAPYNIIYESSTSSDGAYSFGYEMGSYYGIDATWATIQYSTSTTGDSWTDIGYYKPFPDNVKRVKITLGSY